MKWTKRTPNTLPRSQPIELERVRKDGSREQITLDLARVGRFAKLSNLVYYVNPQQTPDVHEEAAKLGYSVVEEFKADDMHAAIFANDDGIIVAFRGTERKREGEVRRAELYDQVTCEVGGRVNAAIHATLHQPLGNDSEHTLYTAIEAKVLSLLEAAGDKPPKLYFTGHSIGGSLAELAAGTMAKHCGHSIIEGIFTFGQMRVGNPVYANTFEQELGLEMKHHRIVMDGDPIPLRPGKYGPSQHQSAHGYEKVRYKHTGTPIVINPWTNEMKAQSSSEQLNQTVSDEEKAMPLSELLQEADSEQALQTTEPISYRPDHLWKLRWRHPIKVYEQTLERCSAKVHGAERAQNSPS